MKKAKINLNEIKFLDLNGADLTPPDLVKVLGNGIFVSPTSLQLAIEMDGIARTLHAGDDVEVNEAELNELINIVTANEFYKPWAQKQIINYFTEKLNSIKDGN